MKAYFVDGGYHDSYWEDGGDTSGQDVELIYAETAGKAKSLFLGSGLQHDATFTELRCYLVSHNVERAASVAPYDDPLWESPCPRLEKALAKGN